MKLVNREMEAARLERTASSGTKELVVLFGRRRLGKTTLLRNFARKRPSLFFSCPIGTASDALRIFHSQMADAFDQPLLRQTQFSNWHECLSFAFEESAKSGSALIFDEFPYLMRSVPGIDSIFQHLWDNQTKPIWIALCGSLLSVMQDRVLGARAPLYGRRTEQMQLKPMTFGDVSQFYKKRSFQDKANLYAFFGGVPAYAERAAKFADLHAAVQNLVLNEDGVLYQEPEFLVREELREPGTYFSILHSLASGCTRPNQIAQDAGIPHSGVNKYLDVLRRMQLAERIVPLTEKKPERSTKALYVIADHFLRFWFRYVYPNRSVIESGSANLLFSKKILPDLDTFMGPVFEEMCRQEIRNKGVDLVGWQPFKIGRYWDSRVEIDVVVEDEPGQRVAFFECKWSRKIHVERILYNLRKKADSIAQYAGVQKEYYVMSRTASKHPSHIRFGR